MNPIARAFVLSIACHLFLFGFIEVGNRLDLWRFSPLLALARAMNLSPATVAKLTARNSPPPPKTQVKKTEEVPEIPLVFVDVDPSQATEEAPKNTPYYSPVNSQAGNPDTSRNTPTAKLEGKQDKVMKTASTVRANPNVAHPLQPAPRPPTPAAEAQTRPQPPPEPAREIAQKPAPPKAAPKVQTADPKPVTPAVEKQEIGDLAMAKPTPPPGLEADVTPRVVTAQSVSQAPQHVRPRTVAAARMMQAAQNPDSATLGEKLKQDGGVKRFSVQSSLDVRASPFGNYDAKFIAAVQRCWYQLLDEQHYTLDRMGKVTLKFRLTVDGRITDMSTVNSDVGDLYTLLCQWAVEKPAPFDKWPAEMRKMLRDNYREVVFTFYY